MTVARRNLLAISWAMPPLLYPRALQVSRLFRQLSLLGWNTTVLSATPRSVQRGVVIDPALADLYTSSFSVVPVDSPEQSLLLRVLFRLVPFLKNMPDEKRLWANRAVAIGKTLASQNSFSVIASFAQPWSSHVAGLRLHQLTGLPWVAHFSDPWADNPYQQRSRRAYQRAKTMEETIVREATHLVFVNSEIAAITMDKYPSAWKDKVSILPHGYDSDMLAELAPSTRTDSLLTIVHSGNFYGPRTPWPFLSALSRLNRATPLKDLLRVIFVGQRPAHHLEKIREAGLEPVVRFVGPKLYLEALGIMRDSDVLLLIEAPSQERHLFFPSKLVDYLLFKKPILGLTPPSGPAWDLLHSLHYPTVEPNDVESIRQALSDLLARKKTHRLRPPDDVDVLSERYDIRQTARTFDHILSDVLQKASSANS